MKIIYFFDAFLSFRLAAVSNKRADPLHTKHMLNPPVE